MMQRVETDVAIVGAGPAGLVAASTVPNPDNAVLIDENPRAGGQIWRGADSRGYLRLVGDSGRPRVRLLSGTRVFDARPKTLYCDSNGGTIGVRFEKLIIATGARELFLPFPGWTLPNVYGAGGLQALAKGGLSVVGKRVVVAGTGPLLLAVASFLKENGARVLRVVEQAPRFRVLAFGAGLWRFPGKLGEAARLLTRLADVPVGYDSYVERAEGNGKLEAVSIRTARGAETVGCDFLACGFHLVPNTELAELLGCRLDGGAVEVDERQQTSVQDIYCAGEPTGIGGLELSMAEGAIAAMAASGSDDFGAFRRRRKRLRKIAEAMNHCYRPREELRSLCPPETVVCRCEDATFGEMSAFRSFRAAKLQTRCGMGACQGRVCGAASRFLFGWGRDTVRPPIFPVTAGALAGIDEDYE